MHSSIGIRYENKSVRALIVDCENGAGLASGVMECGMAVLVARDNH